MRHFIAFADGTEQFEDRSEQHMSLHSFGCGMSSSHSKTNKSITQQRVVAEAVLGVYGTGCGRLIFGMQAVTPISILPKARQGSLLYVGGAHRFWLSAKVNN